jgi:uncharacterized protein DUF1761
MDFPAVNYLAVLLAAVSAFLLGGLWYSPALFAKQWMAYTGHGDCEGEGEGEAAKKGNTGLIFGGAFLLSLIAAYVFAIFLGREMGAQHGAIAGFAAGLFWVATSFGISYLFEQRPLGLWLINGGYHTLQFTLYGLVLGLMG